MRILVIGAGALGGLVGAQLAEAGEDVTLVEINQARARLLNETGLFISQEGEPERCAQVRVVTEVPPGPPFDLLFVAVKTYETRTAVEEALPVIARGTHVLSMQNGAGNADVIAEVIGADRVLCGITYHSIQHTGPNRLRYRAGIKPIQIAPLDGRLTPEIEVIGEVFRRAGLPTNVVENIDHVIWQKLLHNATINATSAVTGLTCREMMADEDLMAFMRDLSAEIIAVMRARGVPIVDEEDPFRPLIGSLKALGKNRPSMTQDLARGKRTEVDATNGAIVREAERLGLPAPHNKALVHFIHSREMQKFVRREEIARALRAGDDGVTLGAARPTRMAADGGMPQGRVPLACTARLKELVHDYYVDLAEAGADPQRLVVCCSGLGPVELVRAMGIAPYFPENHAALIGASRQAVRYIPRALAEGFSQFVPSGLTCDVGALLTGDSPLVSAHGIPGPPRPDLVVYSTNNGHSLVRWFEFYGEHFKVPVLGLHPPAALGELDRIDVDAAVHQVLRMTGRLEAISGQRLDMDRLAEVVGHSQRAAALWASVLALARSVPSPLTFFDMLVHMAPMVLMRGTPEAVEYYTILKAELEERVASGLAAVPGERFRMYWEGPPVWCALSPLARLFLERQVAIVASTFTENFALTELDPDDPIQSMARVYTGIFTNRSDEFKTAQLVSRFEEYGVDGVIYHECRTTPEHSNVRFGLEVRLRRLTGLPSIVLEADSHDPRLFSMERLESLLGEFIERHGGSAAVAPAPSVARGGRVDG